MIKIILIAFVGIQLVSGVVGLDCLDEDGNSVDWMILYKLPKNKHIQEDFVDEGLGYVYFTSRSPQDGWTLSTKSIKDPLLICAATSMPTSSISVTGPTG